MGKCANNYAEPPQNHDKEIISPIEKESPTQARDPPLTPLQPKSLNHHEPETSPQEKTKSTFLKPSDQSEKSPDTSYQITNTNNLQTSKKAGITIPENPKPKTKHTNEPFSPIQMLNRFEALLRPNKPKSTTSSSQSSSSGSGPLFPPGFEDTIPAQIKTEKENKRKRKLEKKKKLKMQSSKGSLLASLPSCTHAAPKGIKVDDVLELANTLGFSFQGSPLDLRKRIENVLQN